MQKSKLWLGLFLVIWFFNLGHVKLLEPDEGRYAEIPREMVVTGNYITPHLNNIKYFEKPPLQYWTTALTYEVFGFSEWTARLWPALTGALTILCVFAFCLMLWGESRAWAAAILLFSSPYFLIHGHLNTLDMGLTFFMTLVMLALGYLLHEDSKENDQSTIQSHIQNSHTKKNIANFVLWSASALGFLSKGLVTMALPAIVLFAQLILQRNFRFLKKINWSWGPILFLLIAAPWVILVSNKNPEFFHFFFIHEHFQRFLTKVHHRVGPWWYFIPIFLAGFFPWGFTFIKFTNDYVTQLLKNKAQPFAQKLQSHPLKVFLILWCVMIFVFFSISSSKLPSYILPIWPAMAILLAEKVETFSSEVKKWLWLQIIFWLAVVLSANIKFLNFETRYASTDLYAQFSEYLLLAMVFLILMMLGLFFAQRFLRHKPTPQLNLKIFGFSVFIFFQIILWGFDSLSPSRSGYDLANIIKPLIKSDTPVYLVRDYVQSLPFYLRRPVTLVQYKNEFEFGLEHEPDKSIRDLDVFTKTLHSNPLAIVVMSLYSYETFKKTNPEIVNDLKIAGQDNRRIILLKENLMPIKKD